MHPSPAGALRKVWLVDGKGVIKTAYFERTDNPIRDYEAYCNALEREGAWRPRCRFCNEPIFQVDAVLIDDDYYCDNCLQESRVWVEE